VNDKTIRRVLAFFLVITAVLIAAAVAAVRNISRSVASSDWVNHTHAIILATEALGSSLHAADGALRTFILTGDAHDLSACREALSQASEHLEEARALTRREPVQHAQIGRIETLVDQRLAFTREALAARQSGSMESVRSLLAADAGGEPIKEIRRSLEKIKTDAMNLLAERDTAAYLQAQTTRWTVWAGVALEVLLLAGVAWLIRDDIAARRAAATALQAANSELEARVQERTSELASANRQLKTENLERQWANQALEHQVHYSQLIVNSISDLVLVLTKVLNISRVNPAVVQLTGLEPAELIQQPLSRIVRLAVPPDGESPLVDPIAQALKNGRDLRDLPAFVMDRRGRNIPVRFTLFPLRDRDKVVGGIVTLQVVPTAAQAADAPALS